MQVSEFLLPLNGASDSAPPWIVGAKNCIDMFLPPEERLKQLFYECLTCGIKMKKWSDMAISAAKRNAQVSRSRCNSDAARWHRWANS